MNGGVELKLIRRGGSPLGSTISRQLSLSLPPVATRIEDVEQDWNVSPTFLWFCRSKAPRVDRYQIGGMDMDIYRDRVHCDVILGTVAGGVVFGRVMGRIDFV